MKQPPFTALQLDTPWITLPWATIGPPLSRGPVSAAGTTSWSHTTLPLFMSSAISCRSGVGTITRLSQTAMLRTVDDVAWAVETRGRT